MGIIGTLPYPANASGDSCPVKRISSNVAECPIGHVDVKQQSLLLGFGVFDQAMQRNNVRVRNVWNVQKVRNTFGPRLFGTFGQHQSKSDPNQAKSPKANM